MVVVVLLAATVPVWLLNAGADFLFSLEQQLSKTELEVQDESVIRALIENPGLFLTGTGLGNIHLFAVDYLPVNFPLFRDQGYKANSGLFFVVGDSGLIGLLILVAAPFFGLQAYGRDRWRFCAEHRKEASVALALIFVSLLSFLLRYDVFYFLLSGFVFSRLLVLRNKAHQGSAGMVQPKSVTQSVTRPEIL
jgi:hypothetical protein